MTNNLTGETRTTVSSGHGNYTVSLLPPGAYMVEASKAGFKNTELPGRDGGCDGDVNLKHSTSAGQRQETVVVTGAGEQLQTETSALGRVTDSLIVESMPLVTRNYTQILALSTGVSADVIDAGQLGRAAQATEWRFRRSGRYRQRQ